MTARIRIFLPLLLALAIAAIAAVPAPATHQGSKNGCTSSNTPSGSLTSPTFSMADATDAATLTFQTFWEIESINPASYDQMIVEYSTDGGATWPYAQTVNASTATFSQADLPLSNVAASQPAPGASSPIRPDWASYTVPLDNAVLEQENVAVRFRFAAGDSEYNGFRGWGVDDVTVTAAGSSGTVTPLSETFESTFGWSTSGLWRRQLGPQSIDVLSPAIDPNLVTLASGDDGTLPDDPNGDGIAWFGDPQTGTFCDLGALVELALDPSFQARAVGTQHTLNVSTGEVQSDAACVAWDISGPNPDSDSENVAPGSDQVQIQWTGSGGPGQDVVEVRLEDPCGESTLRTEFASVEWLDLTVDPASASKTTGQAHTVNVDLLPTQFSGGTRTIFGDLVWKVEGANPVPSQTAPQPFDGQPTPLSWPGSNAGTDTLTVFFDMDDDGFGDPEEPQRTATVTWTAPQAPPPPPPDQPPAPTIALDPASAEPLVTETHTVTAQTANAPSSAMVRWSVSGQNATSGASPIDPATGRASIAWTGHVPGSDALSAFVDLDGDGARGGSEPEAAATANWRSRLQTSLPIEQANSIDELSDPETGKEVNVQGTNTYFQPPGGAARAGARASQANGAPPGFIPLTTAAQIPVGSTLETSKGKVTVEAAQDLQGAKTAKAEFFSGRFQVKQKRATKPVTEMVLKGGSFSARTCGSRAGRGSARAAAKGGKRVRRLWGSGSGRYRTRGKYSSATVRGTKWLVEDRCGGTLTKVARGSVQVRDFRLRKTVTVKAPRSYFAGKRR
jgi:hypothetical protein